MKSILLLVLVLFCYSKSWNQTNHPPEPMMATTEESTLGPCGSGDGGQDGGISPPVGLCLPINDYLLPLLISGLGLGAFSLFYLQKKQEPTAIL